MILHQYPGGDGIGSISPPCLKVELALRLAKADFTVRNHRSANNVRKFSITGRLPVLEIDGEFIADSVLILDRLETMFPDIVLSPQDPEGRMRDRLWEHFVNDYLYWYGFYLRWVHPENRVRFLNALLGGLPLPVRWIAKRTLGAAQIRRSRQHGTAGKTPEQAHQALEQALAMLESGLASGPFLEGRDRPGRGDLALAANAVQCGFRNTMPEATVILRAHPTITGQVEAVYDACRLPLPKWWDG